MFAKFDRKNTDPHTENMTGAKHTLPGFGIVDILCSFSAWKASDAHLYIGTRNELPRTFPKSKIDDYVDFRIASVRKSNNNVLILSLQLCHHNIVVVHNGEGKKKIPISKCVAGELSDGMTSSDDESVVAKGGQKVGSLKKGGAERVHCPSDVTYSDTRVLSSSDPLPTVADSRLGKKRKAKTGLHAAPAASAPVVGAAASAASKPVRAEERNAVAGSVGKVKAITTRLQKCVLPPENVSIEATAEILGLSGEYEEILFALLAGERRRMLYIRHLLCWGTPNSAGPETGC
uniref:Uncharacterized protein n=1 Tax=Glossina morsitans morsitans TaxID=37546 RepID=A0A1B0FM90_GLOMM